MTVVALDAMGGDQAPGAVVEGALLAARDRSLEIALVGRAEQLRPLIPTLPPNLQIVDAPDVVGMTEQPVTSVRQKPRSSIMVGLDLVKQGDAQAFASFGNTGAVMAASLFKLGRVPGVARPALGAIFQNGLGKYSLLLDVGANVECRSEYLLQFGAMGKAYFERVLQHSNPSVGLLNVGEEESKGNQFVREAYRLLAAEEPNFVGNVEGNAMVRGAADIVVTDGFNGNLAIKVSEGVADLLIAQLRRAIKSKAYYMVGARLMRGAFERLQDHMDYQRVGGAPLFGVNGTVIIGHGRANAEAVASGARLARRVGESQFVAAIRDALSGSTAVRGGSDDPGGMVEDSTEPAADDLTPRTAGAGHGERR